MRIVLVIVAVIVGIVLLVTIIGALLPKRHEATRSTLLNAPPADVYRALTAFEAAPQWRADAKRVELLGEVDGRLRFREHGQHGTVTYEVVRQVPPELLVTRIVDRDLGYSGSWTYALAPEGAGTRLTITERGEVSNVIFRFLSRFVFGHTATMDKYLASLPAHLARRA